MKDLNFFKPYLGKKKEKINFNIYIYGALLITGLFIIISFGINTHKIISLNNSINEYNEQLAASDIQVQLKDAENINKQIEILKEYDSSLADILISVKERDNVSATLLKEINSTMPSEVAFKNLDIVENIVLLKGTSTNRTAVAELKHNLSKLPIMTDVYVNSIGTQGVVEGEYSFEIKCVLKDVE